MLYERMKLLSTLLAIFSVGITLAVVGVPNIKVTQDMFPVIIGIAGALAAAGAYTKILWSKRLQSAREKRRVFLIYAREDLDAARDLTESLRKRGFLPWLDVDEITPGAVWKKAVLRALEESAVALVLVSDHIAKKGFVQEELKAALGALQERERDMSPVIPVRLSPSPVPEGLAHVQWVNLFEPDGLDRLESGLRRVTASDVRHLKPQKQDSQQ